MAELGVGIWAGYAKASSELKKTLGKADLKRIAISEEARLAKAAQKAVRKELAKLRRAKRVYKRVPLNDEELAAVFGGAKDKNWRPPILKRIVHGKEVNVNIHVGRQGKHIIGHNNYLKGRSIFNGTMEEAQKLVDEFAGKGQLLSNGISERVNFGKIIGNFIDNETKLKIPTTWGIIKYSKEGVHIVPSNPISW